MVSYLRPLYLASKKKIICSLPILSPLPVKANTDYNCWDLWPHASCPHFYLWSLSRRFNELSIGRPIRALSVLCFFCHEANDDDPGVRRADTALGAQWRCLVALHEAAEILRNAAKGDLAYCVMIATLLPAAWLSDLLSIVFHLIFLLNIE